VAKSKYGNSNAAGLVEGRVQLEADGDLTHQFGKGFSPGLSLPVQILLQVTACAQLLCTFKVYKQTGLLRGQRRFKSIAFL